jgi:protein-S-isoprenylcysteine O-methyltransferase Ste14
MMFNWLSAVVLVLPILLAFLWRIAIEERALLEAFGADYATYKVRTKRLVPFRSSSHRPMRDRPGCPC